jgi:hypothetical protein
MSDRPFIWFSLMTGLCVLFLGLPILVISNAAVEALIIVLDSLTRPTSRASATTLKGTNLKRIGQFCHYLSGHLRYIQLLHKAATTSILNSNFIQSTVPQHHKARRKRRHVGSYQYHRYLVTTHFWNPPWDTGGSPQRRVYVSEGDRRVGGSPQRRVYVSEGDRRQTKGWMTTSRYCYACVFVDHLSDFTYVHLLRAQNGDAVLEAKRSFEATADLHGIRIKHNHADNGIFVAKQWVDNCRDQHQGMTLARVDAHHQNGRATEKYNRYKNWHDVN